MPWIEVGGNRFHVPTTGKAWRVLDSNFNEVASMDAAGNSVRVAGDVKTADIAANAVNATKVATYTESALTPGIAVGYEFDIPDASTGNVDFVLAVKTTITEVLCSSNSTQGSNANTIQVDNGTGGHHITDAMSLNGLTQGQVVRAATLDSTYWTVSAGATLRIVQTKAGGTMACKVVVRGFVAA